MLEIKVESFPIFIFYFFLHWSFLNLLSWKIYIRSLFTYQHEHIFR
jgi:hypothetical protein